MLKAPESPIRARGALRVIHRVVAVPLTLGVTAKLGGIATW